MSLRVVYEARKESRVVHRFHPSLLTRVPLLAAVHPVLNTRALQTFHPVVPLQNEPAKEVRQTWVSIMCPGLLLVPLMLVVSPSYLEARSLYKKAE